MACYMNTMFVNAFEKLKKATIIFFMSANLFVHLSVHMKQLGSHLVDFHEIWYFSIFRKSVENIQVSLKYD